MMRPFIYFPYIDVEEDLLKGISLYLEKIVLLCPSFWRPSETTERLQKEGIVEIKAPIFLDIKNLHIRRMLKEFESLIAMYQDSGYLEYLKIGSLPLQDDDRCHRIISQIKGYGDESGERRKKKGEDLLAGQLLLYLAQEFERQRLEMLTLFREVTGQEENLKDIFSIGGGEEMLNKKGESPYGSGNRITSYGLGPEEDDLLIPQRLRAWMEMYRLVEPGGEIPFTTNPLVVKYLVEESEKLEGEGSCPHAMIQEIVKFSLPCFMGGTIEESLKARSHTRELIEWRTFEREFMDLIAQIEMVHWDRAAKIGIASKGRGLSKYVVEDLTDIIIERVHKSSSLSLAPSSSISFGVYVIPGNGKRGCHELFVSRQRKKERGDETENSIFILIQDETMMIREA